MATGFSRNLLVFSLVLTCALFPVVSSHESPRRLAWAVPRGGRIATEEYGGPASAPTSSNEESFYDEEEFLTPAEEEQDWEDERAGARGHEVDAESWELENEEVYEDSRVNEDEEDLGEYSLDAQTGNEEAAVDGKEDYETIEVYTEEVISMENIATAEEEEEDIENGVGEEYEEEYDLVEEAEGKMGVAEMDDEVDIEDDESNGLAQADGTFLEEEEEQYEPIMNVGSADDLVTPEKSPSEIEEIWEEVPVDVSEAEEEAPFIAEASIENNEVPIGSSGGSVDLGTDDESSANVDRMELADREDEGETTAGGFEIDALVEDAGTDTPEGGPPEDDDDDDDDDKPKEETKEETVVEETREASYEAESATPEAPEESIAPAVIDKETRKILVKELGYKSFEVSQIKPEIAAVVAAKMLRRPTEGIPAAWYKDGPPNELLAKIVKVLKPVAVVAFAGWALVQQGSFSFSSSPSKKSEDNKAQVAAPVETVAAPVESELLSATATVEESEDERPVAPPKKLDYGVKPHSIKPNSRLPDPVDPVDETWLDIGITAIEKSAKAVFAYPQKLMKKD